MEWVVLDPNNKTINVNDAVAYKHRVKIESSGTTSLMTLHNLTLKDTIPPNCTALCYIDTKLTWTFGKGDTIKISTEILNEGMTSEWINLSFYHEPKILNIENIFVHF